MAVRSWVNVSRSEVTNNAVALHYKRILRIFGAADGIACLF
jgi:hypothetical protein